LNQLEQGESLLITRNGRTIGRIEPLEAAAPVGWPEIMEEVWQAQKGCQIEGTCFQSGAAGAATPPPMKKQFITCDAAQAELARIAGLGQVHLFK
jgi:hypothetical protein